jgi:hypothetical protein
MRFNQYTKPVRPAAILRFGIILAWFMCPNTVALSCSMSLTDKLVDLATDDDGHYHAAKPDQRGQVGTVIAVVTIGIVAIIGILIYSQVNNSLPTPANSQLANAQSNVTGGFGDAMQLVPVVLIVLVASLVIGVVQRFG